MVRARHGASQVGCLLVLLFIAAVGYFGLNIGQVYWNYYQYEDAMRQEAHFAGHRSNLLIRERLAAFADSLGLPEGARNVRVRRVDHAIYIWTEYYEHIELPGFVREIHLSPQATGTF